MYYRDRRRSSAEVPVSGARGTARSGSGRGVEPPCVGDRIMRVPAQLEPDLTIGAQLCGRYTLSERLGEGAVSTVFRARDELAERDVALKIFDPLRTIDPVG